MSKKKNQNVGGSNKHGSPTQHCPPTKGSLLVMVLYADNKDPVNGAKVQVSGPTPGQGTTENRVGSAEFKNRQPGSYTVKVELNGGGKLKHYRIVDKDTQAVTVPAGDEGLAVFLVERPAKLSVKVLLVSPNSKKEIEGIKVRVTGAESLPDKPTGKDGVAHNKLEVKAGEYHAKVVLDGDLAKKYRLRPGKGEELGEGEVKLDPNGDQTIVLGIEPALWVKFRVVAVVPTADGKLTEKPLAGTKLNVNLCGASDSGTTGGAEALLHFPNLMPGQCAVEAVEVNDTNVWEVVEFKPE
ncbi:MAG: hypothetical protein ACRD68_11920 [Pyrinomonadaceae bacterium]